MKRVKKAVRSIGKIKVSSLEAGLQHKGSFQVGACGKEFCYGYVLVTKECPDWGAIKDLFLKRNVRLASMQSKVNVPFPVCHKRAIGGRDIQIRLRDFPFDGNGYISNSEGEVS
jgi:hypothetical protein